jgi:uncharacterized RDD family membrane protein YckC
MSDAAIAGPAAERLARSVVTPEGVAVNVRLAGFGERAAALILDLLLLLLALIGLTVVAFLSGGSFGIALWFLIAFALRAFYFTGFELAWNGRTPGKRATSLRVVNRRGGTLAPSAVIARNLMREVELFLPLSIAFAGERLFSSGPWTIFAALIWVGILALLPLFNRDRLRAGDMVAGTWVVVEPKPVLLPDLASSSAPARADPAAGEYRFSEPQLLVYGVKELQVLEDVLRSPQAASPGLRRDVAERIARKIGHALPAAFDATKFLEAFYAAQRRRLETELAFGRRRRDKNDRQVGKNDRLVSKNDRQVGKNDR